jgi:hypothetical protein
MAEKYYKDHKEENLHDVPSKYQRHIGVLRKRGRKVPSQSGMGPLNPPQTGHTRNHQHQNALVTQGKA